MSGPGNRGKTFRNELMLALRMLRTWRHCFDNTGHVRGPKRPGDLMGTWWGHSVLLEAKETSEPSISFSRVETHQVRHLERQASPPSMGIALVAVRWCIPRHPRCFLVPIDVWSDLSSGLGRKSLPLPDGKRPEGVLEVFRSRVRPDEDAGLNELVWDLRPVLDLMVARSLHGLRAGRPDLFQGGSR